MLSPRVHPFPFEAVRDLLGILRAMYAAAKQSGAGPVKLRAIRGVGNRLRAAVELALEHPPNTLGHAAAWERAEHAVRDLGDLVDATTPLEPTLSAAAGRVRGARAEHPLPARELGRRARRSRG